MEEKPKRKTVQRDEKGQFTKGHGKTGGRKVGTKNKYGNVRDRLKAILMPYIDYDPDSTPADPNSKGKIKSFATDLMSIDDPKDRIDAVAKILPFVVPKYSATTISADADRPLDEEQQLLELDAKYTKKEVNINIKTLKIIDYDDPDYDPDDDPNFNIDDFNK